MSLRRPVALPQKEITSTLFKNSEEVVSERKAGLQEWVNQSIQLARRLGCADVDGALQAFLRGEEHISPPPPERIPAWDVAGEWCFNLQLLFSGEMFQVPHKLLLSADGVNASFVAKGHPSGASVKGTGTWEAVEGGKHVEVSLRLVANYGQASADSANVERECTLVLRKELEQTVDGLEGAALKLLGPRPRKLIRESCR